MSRITLQRGVEDVLIAYPPAHLRGKVIGATVRVQTPSTDLPDTGSAATVNPLSTTLSSAALVGTRVLSVVDAAGAVAGRKILAGPTFVGEVESISGNNITLALSVPETIASGSAVLGLDLSITLDASDLATAGNALALWTLDTTTEGYQDFPQPFAVVHRQAAYQLDTNTLFRLAPLAVRLLGNEDGDGADAIASTWESELSATLLELDIYPEDVRSWDQLNVWHAYAVVYFLLSNMPGPDPDEVARWHSAMAAKRAAALDSRRFWAGGSAEVGSPPDSSPNRSRRSFSL